jgi:hypothetical protein
MMEIRDKKPERRRVLDKASLILQLNETLTALHPEWKGKSETIYGKLSSLLDEIYPELEKALAHAKNEFGGTATDWSASLLFNYYLKRRVPLPQHCNYSFVLNEFLPRVFNPLEKAASFALNLFRFLKEQKDRNFDCTPTKWGMVDNTVYQKFIHLTRRPGLGRDSVVYNSWEDIQSMVVIYNGHYFKVPLFNQNKDRIYSNQEIAKALNKIVQNKKGKKNPFPLGTLTSLDRNKWAFYQESFKELDGFSEFFDEIEKSLFVLSLDLEAFPSTKSEKLRLVMDGQEKNRWYDKSLTVSVSGKGTISVNCDHLIMDGSPFLEMINSAFEAGQTSEEAQEDSEKETPILELIQPYMGGMISEKLQKTLLNDIQKERAAIACSHHSLDIGTDFFKKMKLRPDMSFQLFIQMASIMTFKSILSTSQAVEMRNFEYGRYDTILSNSTYIEKLMALFEMAHDSKSGRPFMVLFKAMVENQKNKIVNCKKGEALITYLDALLSLDLPSENLKRKSLDRFKLLFESHPMLKGLMDPDISTSGIPQLRAIETFAFTDFGKDKLGLGYIIGAKNVILGEYRFGIFQKDKDEFIKNLKNLIKKFILLHENTEKNGSLILKDAR